MTFQPPPASACWQHREARAGFEVAYFQATGDGWRIDGTTAAIEDGKTWVVTYSIRLDAAWATRRAQVTARTARGHRLPGHRRTRRLTDASHRPNADRRR